MSVNYTYVPFRVEGVLFYNATCQHCNTAMTVKRKDQKYCCKSCKNMANAARRNEDEKGNYQSDSCQNSKIETLSMEIKKAVQEDNLVKANMLQRQKDLILQNG